MVRRTEIAMAQLVIRIDRDTLAPPHPRTASLPARSRQAEPEISCPGRRCTHGAPPRALSTMTLSPDRCARRNKQGVMLAPWRSTPHGL